MSPTRAALLLIYGSASWLHCADTGHNHAPRPSDRSELRRYCWRPEKEPPPDMGRGPWFLRHLNHGPAALIPLPLVEGTPLPAGAVEEAVERLQEQMAQGYRVDTLVDLPQSVQQQGQDADGLRILNEKGSPPRLVRVPLVTSH